MQNNAHGFEDACNQMTALHKPQSADLDQVSQELAGARILVQTLQVTTRKLQTAQLGSVEGTNFMPVAISGIKHQLESIQTRLKQWASEFSKSTIGGFHQIRRT